MRVEVDEEGVLWWEKLLVATWWEKSLLLAAAGATNDHVKGWNLLL